MPISGIEVQKRTTRMPFYYPDVNNKYFLLVQQFFRGFLKVRQCGAIVFVV